MAMVSPSLLAADFACLGEECRKVLEVAVGAEMVAYTEDVTYTLAYVSRCVLEVIRVGTGQGMDHQEFRDLFLISV